MNARLESGGNKKEKSIEPTANSFWSGKLLSKHKPKHDDENARSRSDRRKYGGRLNPKNSKAVIQ